MTRNGRSRACGPAITRRRLLTSALALAAAPLAILGRAEPAAKVAVLDRWLTGNKALAPFTLRDGTLYVSGDATVEAWDLAQGRRRWLQRVPDTLVFRPRLMDEYVVTGGRARLHAWERHSGASRWHHVGAQELGVPLLHQGRVHCGEGHELLTLDLASGATLWRFATTPGSRIAYAPQGHGNALFLGPGDGLLYCLAADSGELRWKVDRERDWQYLRQLAMAGKVLVAGGYHDEIFGIDSTDGRLLWRFNAGNFINSQLVADGTIYFWSPTGWIYALDAATGAIVWRHRTIDYRDRNRPANWAPIMAELVADAEYLYVLAMDHRLHILDRSTGAEIDRYRLPEPVRPFMCLESGAPRLLLGTLRGEIIRAGLK